MACGNGRSPRRNACPASVATAPASGGAIGVVNRAASPRMARIRGSNTVWFICFAGKDKPEVALAVVVEQQNSTGGQTAAPIAHDVLQALLPSAANS